MENIYFALTEAFNRDGPIVVLASGQAVVYHRIAMMSKDGDWIVQQTAPACARVMAELAVRGARYRPGAPLDIRWLSGGWSSHFEFADDRRRRIRCDFVSRPPRVPMALIDEMFRHPAREPLAAVDPHTLILLKQTQRAKDYAVIAELARRLPPEQEIELTTDPDRVLALAPEVGTSSARPAVRAALAGGGRVAVVTALAVETDGLQQRDRRRVARYQRAAEPYLAECRRLGLFEAPLGDAHPRLCDVAAQQLPPGVGEEVGDGHAE